MNIEICKKCYNYPKFYLLGGSSKDKIDFFGYKDIEERSGTRLSCIVSYNGTKLVQKINDNYDKNIANLVKKYTIPTAKIEIFLKNRRVVPIETICPYYTEHLMSEWNQEK